MKRLIFLIAFLWPVLLLSQNFQWAVSCGKGEMDDYGIISSNQKGEIFLTGDYYPPGIFGEDTLGAGYLPRMLTKIDASGNFEWTKGIHIAGHQCNESKTIFVGACKQTDDVFFIGHFCGDLYFDTIHLTSTELKIILSKYDKEGNCLWAKQLGGSVGSNLSEVSFDDQDNIYILGWAGDTTYFDGHIVFPGRFLAKFSSNGVCISVNYSHAYAGANLNKFCRLKDGGFIFAGHTEEASVIIETDTLISSTIYGGDLLLVKYDSAGNYLWSKLDGHTGAVIWGNNIRINEDTIGNFFVTATQGNDTLFFGNHILPNSGNREMFLVKYDPNGNALWATNSQGYMSDTEPCGLFAANDGKNYVTGQINYSYSPDTVHFGSYIIDMDSDAIFVACYDSSGNCIGARFAKNASAGGPDHYMIGRSVSADDNGNCVISGQFNNTAYFDQTTLTSMGMKDIFIARCTPITGGEEEKSIPQNQLLIYANPNTGKCNITIPEEFNNENNLILKIIDGNGKIIQQSRVEFTEGKIKLDIRAQAKGMYTAILSNGKKSYTGKIVFE